MGTSFNNSIKKGSGRHNLIDKLIIIICGNDSSSID